MRAPAPRYAANDGVIDAARAALGPWLIDAREHVGDREDRVEADQVRQLERPHWMVGAEVHRLVDAARVG